MIKLWSNVKIKLARLTKIKTPSCQKHKHARQKSKFMKINLANKLYESSS